MDTIIKLLLRQHKNRMSAKNNYFIAKSICNIKRNILDIFLCIIFFVNNIKNNTFVHRAMRRRNPSK